MSAGEPAPLDGEQLEVDDDHLLTLTGDAIRADDRPLLAAFARELGSSLHMEELEADASTAESLAAANELRTAILSAVSHDLRTPLAGIKASVTSLLADDVDWPETERARVPRMRSTRTPTGSTRSSATCST